MPPSLHLVFDLVFALFEILVGSKETYPYHEIPGSQYKIVIFKYVLRINQMAPFCSKESGFSVPNTDLGALQPLACDNLCSSAFCPPPLSALQY